MTPRDDVFDCLGLPRDPRASRLPEPQTPPVTVLEYPLAADVFTLVIGRVSFTMLPEPRRCPRCGTLTMALITFGETTCAACAESPKRRVEP
jgi:hypothetical protein